MENILAYEGLLELHAIKVILYSVWFFICVFCVYHFNDSQLMAVKGRQWLNVVSLLFGPFVIFGVYVVHISRKAYTEKMSFSDFTREVLRWDFLNSRGKSRYPSLQAVDISLLDSSGRSIEQIYAGNKKTNVSGVTRLAETIIWEAVTEGASDILIDPETQDLFSVRFRVDGKLQKAREMPGEVAAAVISCIKALSSMDISEKRRSQDGAFSARLGSGNASFRVSSAGVVNGEKLSIRVLNVFSRMLTLDNLGFSDRDYKSVCEAISKQSGMVLLCGPTGSGKTTSLYGMLSSINHSERNIITVEDPVEYQMPGISQIEINTKAGITFANTLRGILRQDPDVITIGEIRDSETAQIAVQASHTGHLVVGTMHSSDNLTSLLRLVDLGIKPVMLADALSLVISQRLVRRLCEHCKSPAKLPPDKEKALTGKGIDVSNIMKANGCPKCRETGYSGRVAIFDVLKMEGDIKTNVFCLENISPDQLRQIAGDRIKSKLHKEAMKLVLQGVTSYNEVKNID